MDVIRLNDQTRFHGMFLLGSILVVLLGVLLSTDGRRVFAEVAGQRIVFPETCALKTTTGVRCAGCGLTRSTVRLLEGDYAGSFHQHRLGWLVFLVIVLQIPYRSTVLCTGGQPEYEPALTGWIGAGLMILLLINWGIYLVAL